MFFEAQTHLEASAGLAANAAATTMVDWLTAMRIAARPFLVSSLRKLLFLLQEVLGQLDTRPRALVGLSLQDVLRLWYCLPTLTEGFLPILCCLTIGR